MSPSYTQNFLKKEFKKRCQRNPHYSLRAFARDLGIARTSISDVIAGKRRLSLGNISKVAKALDLKDSEIDALKSESKQTWLQLMNQNQRRTLSDEEFSFIFSWQYYAILNLANIQNNKSAPQWIATRLGIDKKRAKDSLETLKRLDMIQTKNGRMIRTAQVLQTKIDVPSHHVRNQHRQFLNLAEESLDNVDISLRDIASVTFSIDSSKIPLAKEMLLDFRRKLVDRLQSDDNDEVYTLCTLLFPTRSYKEKV